jgi:Na+-transporting NADH:ubiquinone oxidoreductase subunit NqrC
MKTYNPITEIVLLLILAIIIVAPMVYVMISSATENRCLKDQTNMIEIDGVKADYLICTKPSVYIIKKY